MFQNGKGLLGERMDAAYLFPFEFFPGSAAVTRLQIHYFQLDRTARPISIKLQQRTAGIDFDPDILQISLRMTSTIE